MKEIIKKYLEDFAKENPEFKYEESKLDKCLKYITDEAKKKLNGKNGAIEDKEVFGWAVHFYDENADVEEVENTFKGKTVKLKAEGGYEEVKPVKEEKKPKKEKKVKETNYEEISLF